MSRGVERPSARGFGMFGPHHWPVTLRHGPVVLAPLRYRDRAAWERVRRRRTSSWLRPWEATLPPGVRGRTHHVPGPGADAQQAGAGRPDAALAGLLRPDGSGTGPRLAGQLTVSGIVGGSASWGQIGYWVDQRLAGRGIMPTAVALAVDYCFQVMRLHRIEIAIRPENTKSLRVVAKLGFRPEGLRPRYLHIDGEWRDHLVFALNAEEVPGGLLQRWDNLRQG